MQPSERLAVLPKNFHSNRFLGVIHAKMSLPPEQNLWAESIFFASSHIFECFKATKKSDISAASVNCHCHCTTIATSLTNIHNDPQHTLLTTVPSTHHSSIHGVLFPPHNTDRQWQPSHNDHYTTTDNLTITTKTTHHDYKNNSSATTTYTTIHHNKDNNHRKMTATTWAGQWQQNGKGSKNPLHNNQQMKKNILN